MLITVTYSRGVLLSRLVCVFNNVAWIHVASLRTGPFEIFFFTTVNIHQKYCLKCVLSVRFERFSFLKPKISYVRVGKKMTMFKSIFMMSHRVGMESPCRHFHACALGLVANRKTQVHEMASAAGNSNVVWIQ